LAFVDWRAQNKSVCGMSIGTAKLAALPLADSPAFPEHALTSGMTIRAPKIGVHGARVPATMVL
jgi:hypothetical protein